MADDGNKAVARFAADLRSSISAGHSFAEALERHPAGDVVVAGARGIGQAGLLHMRLARAGACDQHGAGGLDLHGAMAIFAE